MKPKKETESYEGETISFKSTPENYTKEKSGIKNNTIRFTDDWTDDRWEKYKKAEYVRIANKNNPKDFFKEKIIDKTQYKNIVVITWYINLGKDILDLQKQLSQSISRDNVIEIILNSEKYPDRRALIQKLSQKED